MSRCQRKEQSDQNVINISCSDLVSITLKVTKQTRYLSTLSRKKELIWLESTLFSCCFCCCCHYCCFCCCWHCCKATKVISSLKKALREKINYRQFFFRPQNNGSLFCFDQFLFLTGCKFLFVETFADHFWAFLIRQQSRPHVMNVGNCFESVGN